jgi:hypothetical protein
MIHRRGLITGLISLIAAPAIVRASSLMVVKALVIPSHPVYASGLSASGLSMGDLVEFPDAPGFPTGISPGPYYVVGVADHNSYFLGK